MLINLHLGDYWCGVAVPAFCVLDIPLLLQLCNFWGKSLLTLANMKLIFKAVGDL